MALIDNLVSHWTLNETSGTRADSHGSNNLADTNSVASAAGLLGNAAYFDPALAQYLSCADPASLSFVAQSFSIQAWVYLGSNPSAPSIIVKGSGPDFEYSLKVDSSDHPQFFVASGLGFAGITGVTGSAAISQGAWHHLLAWFDLALGTINIAADDGTPNSVSFAAGSVDTTANFHIGGYPAYSERYAGRADEVAVWGRALTSGERTTLYNGGAGLAYPFTVAAAGQPAARRSGGVPGMNRGGFRVSRVW